MGDIEIRCIRVGMLGTNCYVVYDKEKKQAVITDPGDDGSYIAECISKAGLSVAAILITHGHSDHFKGLTDVKNTYKVPVYIHADDAYRLRYQGGFLEASYEIQPDDVMVHDGDHISAGGMDIEVIHTPGHTEGGACYYLKENAVLLAGDTMFFHSWGRTDFEGGDETALFKSIREKLLVLPENTLVLPGHDRTTSIGEERMVHGYAG